jgi:hypothetical protein
MPIGEEAGKEDGGEAGREAGDEAGLPFMSMAKRPLAVLMSVRPLQAASLSYTVTPVG